MKKAILSALSIIYFLTLNVYADENTLFSVSDTKSNSSNYFEYSTSFTDIIKCKDIYFENKNPIFHLDSDVTSIQLEAQPIPINTTDRKLTYSSSDPSIVSIDEKGLMTAHNKGGSAEITVTCGGVSQKIKASVIRAASGINLSRSDMLFYIDEYMSAPLTAEVLPSDATNKNVSWRSSDTSIAYVDENGVVSPVGTGSTVITAKTEDGGFEASCEIYVQIKNIPVRACFITNAVDSMRIGEEYSLQSYIYPKNAYDKTVSWHSSDNDIVSTDNNGNLRANAEGMAVITASSKNGCEDNFTITVYPEDEEITQNIISQSLDERLKQITMPVRFSKSKYTVDEAISYQASASPTVFTTTASKASRADIKKYIDPLSLNTGYPKYQFLDLTLQNGISEDRLNKYLSDKGILRGKADVFINAAKANGISEVYLAVHSALESGNGTSQLATGIDYNGTKVYNLFGIGAYDKDPIGGGSEYAFKQGWTSIDNAIYGAAKWISENYINAGQNTLYKMRWNPSKPGTHQYATDVAWAQKQASVLKSLVEGINSEPSFDMTVYKGQEETGIKFE